MSYVQVNGVDHYYEWITESGASSRGEKPVMVFIHGWAGSSRYWRTTARAIAAKFDCLLYDMRGFGRSQLTAENRALTLSRGYELDTFAEDLSGLIDTLGLKNIWVNAHSMGASVAVFFLNRYRDRVKQAILTCNGIFEYDERAFEAFYRFGRYVVMFRPQWLSQIPLMSRFFMARFLSRPIPSSERKAFLQDFIDADFDVALGTIYTSVSKRATEVMPKEFAQLSVPTLLISGQYDKITPAELGAQAAAINPQAIAYIEIAKTGHFPMLEAPEIYLEHVNTFLADQL
ncbi:MAG: alpha/beta hydrolase [Leptolyngbya sp. SIO1E4]|nr:alpha/beta hydrolase [Leptolyngbya sp. SIO1E4]